jgi:ATP-dependent DNA helicase RecG
MLNLTDIKGIGPAKVKLLENIGIIEVKNLFYHFPYRYIDRKKALLVNDLFQIENEDYHCIGEISKLSTIRLRGGRQLANAKLSDDTGEIAITWFNNPYIASKYKNGDKVLISGKPEKKKIINPKIRKFNDESDIKVFAKLEPIYSETRGLKSNVINTFVKNALPYLDILVIDKLPEKIRKAEGLIDLKKAIELIHFPESSADIEIYRKRLAFDEIYRILKLVQKRKKQLQKFTSISLDVDEDLHNSLVESLPFELTQSQRESVGEIFGEIQKFRPKNTPMHRLLNGDVGSGKTLVAGLVAAQFLKQNHQVILLAPTSVLAKQHYDFFTQFFAKQNFQIHLVTANTGKQFDKFRAELEDSAGNELFIGTHALLNRLDSFDKVGFIIIDEQHKFGVRQREMLENLRQMKSSLTNYLPHVLSMSATPIPRSLALTLYGDLDVSFLQKPIERMPIITKVLYDKETLNKMYDWVENQIIKNKTQVYIVCPLIDESEKIDIKSATNEFENIKNRYPSFRIELLHGRIKPKVKDEILNRFNSGEIDILVTTSVIEVGINNPNATIMIIEGAERFGLAQLHQIRGRVGRSDKQSYCFLKPTLPLPNERLDYFSTNNDGFKIAEYDLLSRGPGEVYGNIQSGLPKLKIASIFDIEFIKKVKSYIS